MEGEPTNPTWAMVSNNLPQVDKFGLGNAVAVKIAEPR